MKKPSLGWQSWSPPYPKWHGFPHWDYSPFGNTPSSYPKVSPKKIAPIRYWCSWYAYGWNITNQKILSTLQVIKRHKLPFTHILIDDGWTTWGDWHTPNSARFPDLISTVKTIKAAGLQTGLWFAPFLANSKSRLYLSHPDWFVKYRGRPIQGLKTLPVWETITPQQYLLDLDLPEVKQYLTDFIDLAINKWGVTLLKLDFLYAPYFNRLHDSDQVPHSQIAWLLSYIKRQYPQVTLIACGTPFAPAIGLADVIRISKDTALPPTIPSLFNRVFYSHRVKMLLHKLSAPDLVPGIHLDPDVRIFSLDNLSTKQAWEKISTNIQGVGDNLTTLSHESLEDIKSWLSQ